MSLPTRFADLAQIRDFFNNAFETDASRAGVVSILNLTFADSLEGETWTVTDNDGETHTGTVGSSLSEQVRLGKLETTYTVSVTNGVSQSVTIGLLYENAGITIAAAE